MSKEVRTADVDEVEGEMARYKPYDLRQDKLIQVRYADQIVAGSFEYALDRIVEEHLDLSVFDRFYRNDQTGRTAYDPKILLKVVLYAYSKGIISSRRIEQACSKNVVFMARRPTRDRTSRQLPDSWRICTR